MTSDHLREELTHLRSEAAQLIEAYRARPLLRGISHVIASILAIIAGVVLVIEASGTLQLVASLVFGIGLALALGTSALYHRIQWRPEAYRRIRKLDHSMIYVLIASSCTPFALIALDGSWRVIALVGIWTLAVIGVTLRWLVENQPRWLQVGTYLGMGWACVALLPGIQELSTSATVLLALGGVLYTVGGLIYLFQRPNPLPKVFGFHEVFHALVVAAAVCQYLAVWPLVTTPHYA